MILCTKCGTHNADGTTFCTSCNGYLAWVGTTDGTPAATSPPEAPVAEEVATPEVERPRVRTVELGRSAPPVPPEAVDPMAVTPTAPPTAAMPRPVEGFEAVPTRTPLPRPVASTPAGPPVGAPPAPPAPPGPGEVACGMCGTANVAERRFCRKCGAPMRDLRPAVDALAPVPTATTKRRWGGWRKSRAAFDTALDLRAKVFRGTMILAGLGFGVSMAPPWGGNVRGWALDKVESIQGGPTFSRILPSEAATVGGTTLEGFPPRSAIDDALNQAWATTWNPQAPPLAADAACGSAATGAGDVLRITFAGAVELDRVVVRAGLEDANPLAAQHRRPKVLDLVFSDGSCRRLTLDDTVDPQREDLEATGVEWVNVNVVDTYPTPDGAGSVTSITELTFEREQ